MTASIVELLNENKNLTFEDKKKLIPTISDIYIASAKNKEELFSLIEHGFDIHQVNKYNKNALFFVKNKSVFKELIKMGVDTHIEDTFGNNLWFSCPVPFMEDLFKKGLNINKQNNRGETPLHTANVVKVRKLLTFNANPNIVDIKGNSPLFYGSYQKKKELLEHGANINCLNERKSSPLFFCDSAEEAQLLVEAGIDVNHCNDRNFNALYYIKSEEALEYLLDNTDINLHLYNKDPKKASLLFGMGLEKTQLFVNKGIDINIVNNQGKNALFYAIDDEVAKFLIEKWINVSHFLEKRTTTFKKESMEQLLKEAVVVEQKKSLANILLNEAPMTNKRVKRL